MAFKFERLKVRQKTTVHKLWTMDYGLWTKKGFTLIELLVVLVILGFLIAMMAKLFTQGDDQRRFDETRARMEEIEKAILGSEGAYAHGQRQFAGYIADMGGLPALDCMGTPADPTDDQPKVFWEQGTLPSWEYKDDPPNNKFSKTWMGWRGPYIEEPPDDILKDGWGNPFIFTNGDLVNDSNKTYMCIQTHTAAPANKPPNITYWEEVSATGEFGKAWLDGKEYSQDSFNITSFGADGIVEGSEYGEDITLTVKQTDYKAPVAGRVNGGVTNVRIYYPVGGSENFCTFPTPPSSLNDGDYFRFESTAPAPGNIDIPVGLRSIAISKDGGATWSTDYIFTLEPTGNWLGDID